MAGKKGTSHRKWSKEDKLNIIRLHLDEHISIREIEKDNKVSHSMVYRWMRINLEEGEDALEPHHGNQYSALHTSKSLSEIERLR